ncbi:MAG: SpoIIE family protein phosphatase [Firmicutes bacterium]|nr:SpoIIE family protein phosphatase [Bacillota bacterium]
MLEKIDIYPYRRIPVQRSHSKPQLQRPSKTDLRLNKIRETVLKVINWPNLLLMGIAFILARGLILNELWPFGSAWMAATTVDDKTRSLGIFLATMAGLWTVTQGADFWSSAAVLILLLIVLRSLEIDLYRRWLTIPILVLVTNLVTKSCFLVVQTPSLYQEMAIIFESLMTAILTFVFMVVIELIHNRDGEEEFSLEEKACFVLLVVSLIIGINDIYLKGFSLGGIVSRLSILIGAYLWGAGMGSAVGVGMGVLPNLSQAISPYTIGFLGLSGLLAGAFRTFGKIGVVLGFMLGNLMLSFYLKDGPTVVTSLAESSVAAVLLLLVPSSWIFVLSWPASQSEKVKESGSSQPSWFSFFSHDKLRIKTVAVEERPADPVLQAYTVAKLQELAQIFQELARPFDQIASTVTEEDGDKLMGLFNSLATRVCKNCPVYRVCWENEFFKTYKAILGLFSTLETKGTLTEDEISPEIRRRCVRLKELAATINHLFDTQKLNHYWQKKVTESREVVSAQLRGVAAIMAELATSIRQPAEPQPELEKRLRKQMKKQGVHYSSLTAYQFSDGNLEIRLNRRVCREVNECRGRILEMVSQSVGQRLAVQEEECCWRMGGNQCSFKLVPAWTYEVTTAVGQIAKEREVSGDSVSSVDLPDGKHLLLLSDGMGVGERAAHESQATIQLLEQLLQAGFDKNLAIKTINSILVLRNGEEFFSTIDLTLIDLNSGVADFIKVGAAPSFVKRGSKLAVITANSLPAGILQTIEVESLQCNLLPGDILVMVTDGVPDAHPNLAEKDQWIKKLLEEIKTEDPQTIADVLLEQARKLAGGQIKDDMTVLVARIGAAPV